ncbi:hypothetical protein [Billgrantia montanilacus]|nr:hypothetical protein [Halomonas montanilacus]
MQNHHSSFGALSTDQHRRLMRILNELRDEPLSRGLMILAYRLARMESAQ